MRDINVRRHVRIWGTFISACERECVRSAITRLRASESERPKRENTRSSSSAESGCKREKSGEIKLLFWLAGVLAYWRSPVSHPHFISYQLHNPSCILILHELLHAKFKKDRNAIDRIKLGIAQNQKTAGRWTKVNTNSRGRWYHVTSRVYHSWAHPEYVCVWSLSLCGERIATTTLFPIRTL